ncbi:MAG: DUF2442 domain-containing protein [Hyphomicrobiales bacterium]|nr:DUF2442 domain-containing protein [Hyphomicrobiales bacterium]
MIARVLEAKHAGGYRVWLKFHDGLQGDADLSDALRGEVFEPLKDVNEFRKFKVDPLWQTLVWENGADLAPESLYERVKRANLTAAE